MTKPTAPKKPAATNRKRYSPEYKEKMGVLLGTMCLYTPVYWHTACYLIDSHQY